MLIMDEEEEKDVNVDDYDGAVNVEECDDNDKKGGQIGKRTDKKRETKENKAIHSYNTNNTNKRDIHHTHTYVFFYITPHACPFFFPPPLIPQARPSSTPNETKTGKEKDRWIWQWR